VLVNATLQSPRNAAGFYLRVSAVLATATCLGGWLAGWLGGWVGGCYTPVLYQNG